MSRVLLVTNVPTPYRVPLFAELHRQLSALGHQLRVVFGAAGYARRSWEVSLDGCGFDHRVLRSRSARIGGDAERTAFSYGGLGAEVDAFAPDVVVVSGFSAATARLWLRRLRGGPPYMIWSGSVPHPGRLDSLARRVARRLLARRASGAVAYGTAATDYLQRLGVPPTAVHTAVNTVDTSFFADETDRLRCAECAARETVGRLLVVGYLSPRKEVRRVLDLAERLARTRDDFVIDVVGDGDDRAALEADAAARGLGDRVVFHGYKQRHELPAFLARSRALLFQTGFDIWGLVLNEAMAAGVPCLASVNAGATRDLVRHGETGLEVDFADTERAAELAGWLLDHPAEAAALGARGRAHVEAHATLAVSARGFVDAVLAA